MVACVFALAHTADARDRRDPERAPRVIVKLASEGTHAIEECAQQVFERAGRFENVSADGSDSLDRLHERHGVRQIRALFRRADGRPLREQRAALRRRSQRPRARSNVASAAAVDDAVAADLSHVYVVRAAPETSIDDLLESYAADPHVAWVQRDYAHELDALPDDPFFLGVGSWGQSYFDLWGLHRIRAPEAWEITRGEGIVVAVVDSGIDYDHPDIAENVWVNPGEDLDGNGRADASDWNGIDDDGNGFIDDLNGFDFANSIDTDGDGRYDGPGDVSDSDPWDDRGHGTHVAGTIAAVANNGIGIVGVAPGAKVMAIKGFAESGPGLDSNLWSGVLYAAANGASVINTSWSCGIPCPSNPLAEEVVSLLSAQGVVIVTSAGNRNSDVVHNSPENMREVITVGSSGEDDRPSETFTNFGWVVDLAAPGGGPFPNSGPPVARRNILSLRSSGIAESEDAFTVADDYVRWAGTSMSAPHVAGAVALLQSAHPGLDYEAIRRVLRESAVDRGPTGFDSEMGSGRLDALAALEHGPPADLVASIDWPRPRTIVSPEEGVVAIAGSAHGEALLAYDLSWGRGNAPTQWTPIAEGQGEAVERGILAIWDVSELSLGSYVLKLEVHGLRGELYEEHVQLSLERVRVAQHSSFGPPAERPSLSGDRVVWHSRRDPESETGESEDWNLFATRLSTGEEVALELSEADQKSAYVSGDTVVWLDDRAEGQSEDDVYACTLDRLDGVCDGAPIAVGPAAKVSPGVVGSHVIWEQSGEGAGDLQSCRMRPDGSACEASDLGLPESTRFLLGFGEREIAFFDHSTGGSISTCTIDPSSGACPERAFDELIFPAGPPVVSGSLVAYERFEGLRKNLYLCELDPVTGACPEILVRRDIDDETPRLSGNRLVWHDARRDQAADIYLCEYDRVRQRCPVQRVTAEMSAQLNPDVSGDRVIWQDHRLGSAQIFGLQLPGLRALPERMRIAEGRSLRLPIRATHGGGAALRFEVEVDGEDAAALGLELIEWRAGWGMLRWRPGHDQAGEYVVTVTAFAEGTLATRRSMRIEVVEANARPRIVLDTPGVVAIGEGAVLDACASFDPDGDTLSFAWEELPLHRATYSRRKGRSMDARETRVVGTDCRLELAPVRELSLRRFRLRVSDGAAQARRSVPVAWLPERWLRWWSRR